MNADNFSGFLSSNARLYHLSYVELESLVLEFPYSQNLHLLLFAKSWLEQHPQADANLRNAALYSTDRQALYAFVQELSGQLAAPSAQFLMQEDYLELSELPRLPELQELPLLETGSLPLFDRPTQIAAPPAGQAVQPRRKAVPPPPPDRAEIREKLSRLFLLDEPETTFSENSANDQLPPNPPSAQPAQPYTKVLQKAIAHRLEQHPAILVRPSKPADYSSPAINPQPKSTFNSWKRHFSASYVQERLDELRKALRLPKENVSEDPADVIARESIRDNQSLASEPLAEIFLRQGQKQKAVEVYERLILIFPEKTAFFAARIENIKKSGQ